MTPDHVPVFDHLARNFCICDRWFCSVAGPTMPNRFFAVAGTTNGVVNNTDVIVGEFGKFKSFFRHLNPAAWRWYSSDPGILRAIDKRYMFDNENDHFAYFDQHTEIQPRSFLRDVLGDSERKPELQSVSWIDPNFAMSDTIDFPIVIDGPGSNDDHPPSPVINGQKLVNKVYQALAVSQYRDTSLLIVIYDEHGGFFDHVPPPGSFGPRIPALLVSAHVKRGVCSTPFDHASVIKTILLRFGDEESIGDMPESVQAAADLSVAIRDDSLLVPFTEVPNAGNAAILPGDLSPAFLPNNGSTLSRALAFNDEALTDLQRDIIQGIAIPLRTGYKFLRRVREHGFLKVLLPLLTRVLKPGKRLEPRRP
jgi:phospholipase C